MHSKVGFEIAHLVVSTVEGRFKDFEGQITLADPVEKSSVEAKVQIASIDTGVEKRDEHLRSADFFDAGKHPAMIFRSSKISKNKDGYSVEGDLSLKGVTKRVSFQAGPLAAVKDGYGQDKMVFKAKAKISRKEFGLTWNQAIEIGPVVGDQVEITLSVQAVRGKQSK